MKVFIIESSGFAGEMMKGLTLQGDFPFTQIIKLDSNILLTFAFAYAHAFIWKLESP